MELIHSHIDGQPVAGHGGEWTVVDPATEAPVATLSCAGPKEVEQAVACGRSAFEAGTWRHEDVAGRQRVLRKAAALIRDRAEELADLESRCAGLPLAHLVARQVPRAAENFEFFAEVIGQIAGETFEQMSGYLTLVTREPAGVAALLSPSNAPLALSAMQVASCIAFGNSCVLKPSEQAPLAVHRMVEILAEAGLPPGVVAVLHGEGDVTGQALVSHPGIDRIALTGRTETGRQVMAAAAANLTPVQLMLSGNSANLVFADAPLSRAVDGALLNAFANSGRLCVAGSRILVERSVLEPFIDRFVERVQALRVGSPSDPDTEIGPLASGMQRDRFLEQVRRGCDDGAELLCGGRAHPDYHSGYFVEPTVLMAEDGNASACHVEVFGPFVTVLPFDDEEEALDLANGSAHGLVAYAWTGDLARALRLQAGLRAGTVWINSTLARDLRAPWGGRGQSGIGREGPRHCADFFSEEKTTILPRREASIRRLGVIEETDTSATAIEPEEENE